jgi:hypothetical protein
MFFTFFLDKNPSTGSGQQKNQGKTIPIAIGTARFAHPRTSSLPRGVFTVLLFLQLEQKQIGLYLYHHQIYPGK